MLYVALILGAILLVGANLANLRRGSLVGASIGLGLICCVLPILIGGFVYVLWEFAALVVVAAVIAARMERRVVFLPLSVAAALLVFGLNGLWAWSDIESYRAQFPFESIEDRLPERPATAENFSEKVATQLAFLERNETDRYATTASLEDLHEHAVQRFINRPNFGVARLSDSFDRGLKAVRIDRRPVPQPGVRSISAATWTEVGKEISVDDGFQNWHESIAFDDFLNPMRLGYVKDRRRVSGFRSHSIDRLPSNPKQWRLQAIDLVGLVVHKKPVVYISENLPQMDELRKVPLRDLNAFESVGLKALESGDELFVREMPDSSVRMLGAIRAHKQCIKCHGGARGDLLGAFSYELRRE